MQDAGAILISVKHFIKPESKKGFQKQKIQTKKNISYGYMSKEQKEQLKEILY
jgi:hypothetical protein